jgi:hypothetical protein
MLKKHETYSKNHTLFSGNILSSSVNNTIKISIIIVLRRERKNELL